MDESNKQHIEEIKEPIQTKPKEAKKYDYEYKRNGVSSLFRFLMTVLNAILDKILFNSSS